MTMRVLVTGAAGFLGSHLTDRLIGEGHSVIGVDNLSTGDLVNIAHLSHEPLFTFEQRDICLPFDPGPVDAVYNMASPASPPGGDLGAVLRWAKAAAARVGDLDSDDDTIAALAGETEGRRLVVTADRELRRRCEEAGSAVTGPRWLLALL